MKRLIILAAIVFAALGLAGFASADTSGLITFDGSPAYTVGNINGQNGWSNTGSYDANVVTVTGGQALQISNARTSGSFGDQTFAPLLTDRSCCGYRPAALHCELRHRHDAEHTADRPVHLDQP